MIGPGKYENEATYVREETNAEAVVVCVIGGKLGSGFSVQAPAYILSELPRMLRAMADGIEGDYQKVEMD